MSSSITIPTASSLGTARTDNKPHHRHHLRSMDATMGSPGTPSSSAMTPSSSSASSSAASPASSSMYSATPSRIPKSKKGKNVVSQSAPAPPTVMEQRMQGHNRRPSLLGSAIAQQEAHVINIGDPDGPPRLISYLASSQGFVWNPEIFIPSYVDYDYTPLENRREPIHEIFLSDEEIEQMFPK
ncbi:hypothetical protein SCUCBS95973_000094 [Sporothrix curviconia]|uniref:Uncharacterized protein n=1 Tax=Sporothrix curviconia TaxID=1260050 RepID=A0ABP0AMY3_9PEZI